MVYRRTLSSNYGVRGIPSLIVINASDGSVITRDGRQDIQVSTWSKSKIVQKL